MKLTKKECTQPPNLKNRNSTTRSRRVNRPQVQPRISKIVLKTKKRTSGRIRKWKSTGKGFWFAFTCVCSLYMFLKTLLIFHNSK